MNGVLGLISNLIGPIWEGAKALFFMRSGQKKEQLKQKEVEVRNVKLAAKRKNEISNIPPSDLDDLV